jgi:glycosyltransferase involved in cell wall biosynthesis
MKILQVIPYFVPAYSYGGPIKGCFDISKELTKRGHEITVVTTDTLDGDKRITRLEEEIGGIRIIRFRNISNWLAKNCNGYLPAGFYNWTKKNIHNFDVVHCHDFFTLQNIIIAHRCKKNNIPFIIQPHGTLSPTSQKAKFKITKKIFLKFFGIVLKNSRNIIALTEKEKKEIISIDDKLRDKIEIIPNGLEINEFKNIKRIDLHQKYRIPDAHKIIGYLGRIQYIKGIDISLAILSRLINKLDITYLIIGPDEGEKKKLENKIRKIGLESNVIFAGILSGNEKLEIMKSCDLFLFTSRSEGLPMSVLEVAALGVPQVISENCNVPEIENSNAGFILDLEDAEGFVYKILEVLNNENLHKKLSENSPKMISEYFDLQIICNRIEYLIKLKGNEGAAAL